MRRLEGHTMVLRSRIFLCIDMVCPSRLAKRQAPQDEENSLWHEAQTTPLYTPPIACEVKENRR
jgi:hypothetical protein